MDRIDPIDLALLDRFQRDFPLDPRPFARIAVKLGLSEAEVIERLTAMQAAGRIARVGGTVRPNTAGASTLAAMAVPEARIDEVAEIVSAGLDAAFEAGEKIAVLLSQSLIGRKTWQRK